MSLASRSGRQDVRIHTLHLEYQKQFTAHITETFDQKKTNVKVLDVSAHGFCLWSPTIIDVGTLVTLHLDFMNHKVAAKVTWVAKGPTGFKIGLKTTGTNPTFDLYSDQLVHYALYSC